MKRPFLKTLVRSLTLFLCAAGFAQAQLALQKDDVVAIIGNGLGDRMQHDGWVETAIQKAHPSHNLRIRNLAYSGDTIDKRPRNKGFTPHEQYLKDIKADVIFVMFGYNESFGGEGGLSKFKSDLGGMVDKYKGLKFNGESESRFVLFSPIAHEDLKDPNLPDGKANNANLALYTKAIAEVAAEKKVGFVEKPVPELGQEQAGQGDKPVPQRELATGSGTRVRETERREVTQEGFGTRAPSRSGDTASD